MELQNNLKLRKSTFSDWLFLLSLRNEPETRINSHNTNFIDEEEHKNWLQKPLENNNRLLFICSLDDKDCGSVRCDYDEIDNSYELSWTISPHFRGKGVGKNMVKKCIDLNNLSRIKSEVKKDNISSIKISEYVGMVLREIKNNVCYFTNYEISS